MEIREVADNTSRKLKWKKESGDTTPVARETFRSVSDTSRGKHTPGTRHQGGNGHQPQCRLHPFYSPTNFSFFFPFFHLFQSSVLYHLAMSVSLFLATIPLTLVSLPTPSTLVKLADYPEAVCIDGSPATFYYSKGTNATAFLFHHQGGGWCQTAELCAERAATALGSSKDYPASKDLRTVGE